MEKENTEVVKEQSCEDKEATEEGKKKENRKWVKLVSKHRSSVERNIIVNDWFAAFIYSKNISWFSSTTTFLMDDRCLFKDKGKWLFF